jgi:predicted DNA-binding antitoxin AbrB/MazE fold protein
MGKPMTPVIDAVYESGVLRPLQKIDLKEGTRVRVTIEEPSAVIKDAFGLLKGKDTTKALEEQGEEEPLDRAGAQKKIR